PRSRWRTRRPPRARCPAASASAGAPAPGARRPRSGCAACSRRGCAERDLHADTEAAFRPVDQFELLAGAVELGESGAGVGEAYALPRRAVRGHALAVVRDRDDELAGADPGPQLDPA